MTDRTCPARYERPGGRERGDRIVKCHLQAGHPGEHEEADTEVTWMDDTPTFDVDEVFGDPLTATGLTTEQEIRARAALAAHPPFGTQSRIQVIEEIAAYIRDGSHIAIGPPRPRVSAEERSDDTEDSSKITEVG